MALDEGLRADDMFNDARYQSASKSELYFLDRR